VVTVVPQSDDDSVSFNMFCCYLLLRSWCSTFSSASSAADSCSAWVGVAGAVVVVVMMVTRWDRPVVSLTSRTTPFASSDSPYPPHSVPKRRWLPPPRRSASDDEGRGWCGGVSRSASSYVLMHGTAMELLLLFLVVEYRRGPEGYRNFEALWHGNTGTATWITFGSTLTEWTNLG